MRLYQPQTKNKLKGVIMITLKRLAARGSHLVAAIAIVGASLAPVLFPASALAATQMSSRSLTQSSTAPGTQVNDAYGVALAALAGTNGAKTSNLFTFTVANTGTAMPAPRTLAQPTGP
jgi:hypothetical protein